jgi:hypothetical protein
VGFQVREGWAVCSEEPQKHIVAIISNAPENCLALWSRVEALMTNPCPCSRSEGRAVGKAT